MSVTSRAVLRVEQRAQLAEQRLAPQERRRLRRQVVRPHVERRQRRERVRQAGLHQLEEVLGAGEVLQAVRAEVAQVHVVGERPCHELGDRRRQQDLPTVRRGHHARGAVDGGAVVVAPAGLRLADVRPHAHAQRSGLAPRLVAQPLLRRKARSDRVRRGAEHGHQPVASGLHHRAAAALHGRTQDGVVAGQRTPASRPGGAPRAACSPRRRRRGRSGSRRWTHRPCYGRRFRRLRDHRGHQRPALSASQSTRPAGLSCAYVTPLRRPVPALGCLGAVRRDCRPSGLVWGVGDFAGGKATQRAAALPVVWLSKLVSLPLLAIYLVATNVPISSTGIAWGGLAGVAGVIGLVLFYRALSAGAMTVVAPVTGVTSAAIPVVVGLLAGERPSGLQLVGVGCALLAIALVSISPHPSGNRRAVTWRLVAAALGAGIGFALFFILIAVAGDAAGGSPGLWPIAGSQLSALIIGGLLLLMTRPGPWPRSALPCAGRLWPARAT